MLQGVAIMPRKKTTESENDFPPGLAAPARRALAGAGYTRLAQLARVTEADLLKLHGMGPSAIRLIRGALKARGLSFANPESNRKTTASKEQVFDSPREWVRSHIRDYVESEGRKGHRWRGVPTLLLTTRGRKSGRLRRTALIYGRDGKNYLLVASNGGAANHPLWYLNLVENPRVELQVGADKFAARARSAAKKEKPRMWKLMIEIYPPYDSYQAKTRRDIPVVVVEPI